MRRHLIIGGGISGLMTAEALVRKFPEDRDLEIEIFEAQKWGGMIQSQQTPFGLVEKAANGFLSSQQLYKLELSVKLPSIGTRATARKRYIRMDQLRRWPLSFFESLWTLVSLIRAKLSGTLPPRSHENLIQWGRRCFGRAFTEKILRVAVQGIYASSGDSLSATLVTGRFFRPSPKGKKLPGQPKGLRSFPKGMQSLPEAIRSRLQKDSRVQWHEREVLASEIQNFQNLPEVASIWVATKAPEAAQLLTQAEPELAKLLRRVPQVPVVSVTLFFERNQNDPEGFGYLNHPDLGRDTLGVLWNDQIFPNRSDFRSETWILRGEGPHRLLQQTDFGLRDYILKEREELQPGGTSRLKHFEITRWPLGLPHYSMELEEIQEHFHRDWGKVRLVGNYVRGIGLTQIAEWIQFRVDNLKDEI